MLGSSGRKDLKYTKKSNLLTTKVPAMQLSNMEEEVYIYIYIYIYIDCLYNYINCIMLH